MSWHLNSEDVLSKSETEAAANRTEHLATDTSPQIINALSPLIPIYPSLSLLDSRPPSTHIQDSPPSTENSKLNLARRGRSSILAAGNQKSYVRIHFGKMNGSRETTFTVPQCRMSNFEARDQLREKYTIISKLMGDVLSAWTGMIIIPDDTLFTSDLDILPVSIKRIWIY